MSGKIRILMLEDVATDAELIEKQLCREGMAFDSIRVETEDAYTRALEDFGPEIILADFKLPCFDFFSALKIAREKCPDVPIIVVSGSVGEETAVELLKKGATDYVLKDSLARLAPSIKRALCETHEKIELKRAEETLLLYRWAVESSFDLISVVDGEYRYHFTNESFLKYRGLTREQVEGKTVFEVLGDRLFQEVIKPNFDRCLRGEEIRFEFEGDYTVGRRVLDIAYLPFRDGKGNIAGVLTVSRDITERKRAEMAVKENEQKLKMNSDSLELMVEERTRELKLAQEKIIQVEKLAVLGKLAGGVSHELRNPLGAIKNSAYFLAMVLDNPEPEVRESLEILEKEVAAAERIIGSMLDFARPRPPSVQRIVVNRLIEEEIDRTRVPARIEVVKDLSEKTAVISADGFQLGLAFGNIIKNAVQAMPDEGLLSIRTQLLPDKRVSISFTDTGTGIPAESIDSLFEPLFTTKAKGIGLGLAITKTMVERNGGSIEVVSAPDKGSTFTVILPSDGETYEQHD